MYFWRCDVAGDTCSRLSWKTSENSRISDFWAMSISRESSALNWSMLEPWRDVWHSPSICLMLPTLRSRIPQGTICLKGVRSIETLRATPWYAIQWVTRIPIAASFCFPEFDETILRLGKHIYNGIMTSHLIILVFQSDFLDECTWRVIVTRTKTRESQGWFSHDTLNLSEDM